MAEAKPTRAPVPISQSYPMETAREIGIRADFLTSRLKCSWGVTGTILSSGSDDDVEDVNIDADEVEVNA